MGLGLCQNDRLVRRCHCAGTAVRLAIEAPPTPADSARLVQGEDVPHGQHRERSRLSYRNRCVADLATVPGQRVEVQTARCRTRDFANSDHRRLRLVVRRSLGRSPRIPSHADSGRGRFGGRQPVARAAAKFERQLLVGHVPRPVHFPVSAMGLLFAPLNGAALVDIDPSKVGQANGMFSTGRFLSGGLGVAATVAVLGSKGGRLSNTADPLRAFDRAYPAVSWPRRDRATAVARRLAERSCGHLRLNVTCLRAASTRLHRRRGRRVRS